jgi:hypothetical protein
MRTASLPLIVAVALAAAWHVMLWGVVRTRAPVPATLPPDRPVAVFPQPPPGSGPEFGLLRSPVLFALPHGPGFSRYLDRNTGADLRPRMEFPDLVPVLARAPVAITNRVVLGGVPREDVLARLRRMPPDPETRAEPSAAGPVPSAASPDPLRLRAPPGWSWPDEALAGARSLVLSAWSATVRLEVSESGAVLHVFFEEDAGLTTSERARLSALIRLGRLPAGAPGRNAVLHLQCQPAGAP